MPITDERRTINRITYSTRGFIVVQESGARIYVEINNLSPLGMGITIPAGNPSVEGKDVIVVSDTFIMYATVIREVKADNGSSIVGIEAKKFPEDVLMFLFDSIGKKD